MRWRSKVTAGGFEASGLVFNRICKSIKKYKRGGLQLQAIHVCRLQAFFGGLLMSICLCHLAYVTCNLQNMGIKARFYTLYLAKWKKQLQSTVTFTLMDVLNQFTTTKMTFMTCMTAHHVIRWLHLMNGMKN